MSIKGEKHKDEYPINLFKRIAAEKYTSFVFNSSDINDDVIEGLRYTISSLSEREQSILQLRYRENKPLRETGEILGVSAERVRSQECRAIYRLSTPPRVGYIRYGKKLYERMIVEHRSEKERAYTERGFNIPIEELDLSVRAFNNLKKIGCNTLSDVAALTDAQIMSIKNLGKKSRIEIAEKVVSLGAYNTVWTNYLLKEKK